MTGANSKVITARKLLQISGNEYCQFEIVVQKALVNIIILLSEKNVDIKHGKIMCNFIYM